MLRGLAWVELREQPFDERPARGNWRHVARTAGLSGVGGVGRLFRTEDLGEEAHLEVPESWTRAALRNVEDDTTGRRARGHIGALQAPPEMPAPLKIMVAQQ